ncbi:TIGR03086 family metal-binding protein [Pseudonocardia humida]|uniref:TIGR03086 family protein n=1 Tax=Pseudonocardia humida TaxID=2800819 RepID=A0ABT0ZXD5_9PSEU|nr:TIGR03086 family metal-binding protein [Pseudonocardia humida]MCO1655407.1 TIGR03086 family protein [Pseudonocardia humida]
MDGVDRYRRALRSFGELVRAVPADGWARPSPCPGWSAADVVEHVAGAQRTLLSLLGADPGRDGPSGPRERWLDVEARVLAALDDPSVAGRRHATPLGEVSGVELADMSVVEPLVHRWDLARAVGADDAVDEELAAGCLAIARRFAAVLRGPGMYGPELAAPADASAGPALLAYLGRRP